MGFDKLFARLGGKPVVARTLEAFQQTRCVDQIILVGHTERLAELQELVRQIGSPKMIRLVSGGARRQDSVRAGLGLLNSDVSHVAVHDAARPFITPAQIERVFALCRVHGAAALAAPVTDTLKRVDENGFVTGSLARKGIYAMETPQIFSRELLIRAYENIAANELSITDEVSAVEQLGARVLIVPNEEFNPKITFPRDLLLAESWLTRRS